MPKKINAAEIKKMDNFNPEAIKLPGFEKNATLATDASAQYGRVPLFWQDPLYDSQLVMFPEYNLPEANKRYRHYYKFNPILSSCVDAHATFPLSDFQNGMNGFNIHPNLLKLQQFLVLIKEYLPLSQTPKFKEFYKKILMLQICLLIHYKNMIKNIIVQQ